jgi:hypothetical protein
METPELLAKLMERARLVLQLARLPVVRLRFEQRLDPEGIRHAHALFTRPHPRYKVFRNKTMGIALIDLSTFGGHTGGYLHSVRRSGHAGPQSRKATARGYRLRRIDRNDHVDEIHAIHTSCAQRQGRPMDESYLVKKSAYEDAPHFECYGVFDADGRLAAYCSMGRYGNFVATDQLMGYKNQDGIMYLLLLTIICRLIEEREVDYFMYDTFLGAQPGLRDFKRRVGFRPYRARYELV